MNPIEGIGASYLGKADRKWPQAHNMTEAITLDRNCYAEGKLLDGTKFDCLFDTGCTSALMTMKFYAKNKILHKAQKLSSTVQHITVGNGQKVPVQFIVLVQVIFGEHLFEFYCMVIDTPDSC